MEYAARVKSMKPSEIRELLKVSQQPGVISFGGGMPSPHSFPIKEIEKITCHILERHGASALQYGPTEGNNALREVIAKRMRAKDVECGIKNIIITSGSQQALDLVGKIFINPGDYVAVECPTYLGALNAFNAYQARYVTVPMDRNGMKTDVLEKKLKTHKVKFIYTVPTFQNPSGITMSLERRRHLLEIAEKHDIPILEDDAYSDLRFSGKPVCAIKSMDKKGLVIYTHTLSKSISPGFRLGYVVASEEIARKISIAKQEADLGSNVLCQYIATDYLESGDMEEHLPKIRKMYKNKRDVMLRAMKKYFPKGASWTKPEGGLFIWVTLPGHIDTKEMLKEAMKDKVLYVSGGAFCVDTKIHNTMRLNFSNTDNEKIELGIRKLARIIKKRM